MSAECRIVSTEHIVCEHEVAPMEIARYRLSAGSFAVEVITLGATIVRFDVPDPIEGVVNVVLGHAELRNYARGREYFGGTVGRLANRLAHGRLLIDGRMYQLSRNDGVHHLHGGYRGFDKLPWRVVQAGGGTRAMLELALDRCDGDEGYPGAVHVTTICTLDPSGELCIDLRATSDAPTVVNLTNHSYFNLRGEGRGDVLDHELSVAADHFLPVDQELIPTGEIRPVTGTPFDFRKPTVIGSRIAALDEQLQRAGGFDHCLVLHDPVTSGSPHTPRSSRAPALACRLEAPDTRRRLEVWTERPCVQFYSGNFLDGSAVGAGGARHGKHAGLCLETQCFPDAPNHPSFPSVELRPGVEHRAVTLWRFDV